MIPTIMNIRIRGEGGSGFRLWLPLFMLWPIALAILVVLLPFLIIAEVVLWLSRIRISVFRTLFNVFLLVSAMRGLKVHVNSAKNNSLVNITVL